jgi:hypothetical protein
MTESNRSRFKRRERKATKYGRELRKSVDRGQRKSGSFGYSLGRSLHETLSSHGTTRRKRGPRNT